MKVSTEEKKSVINLFKYVREIYDIKRPFEGNFERDYISWDDIDDDLPGVEKCHHLSESVGELCTIQRLSIPRPPLVDKTLENWVRKAEDGSVTFLEEIEYLEDDENEIYRVEKFTDDPLRVELEQAYIKKVTEWRTRVEKIRKGNELFETFLMYRDQVQSSNLKQEIVLGNYIFDSTGHPSHKKVIKYPILTSAVSVEILQGTEAKLVVKLVPDEKTVIHNEIFVAFNQDDLNGQELSQLQNITEESNCNLIDAVRVQNIISSNAVRLSTKCRWRSSYSEKCDEEGVYFQIYPMPVFFVQTKSTGLKEAVGSIIKNIEEFDDVPRHLVEMSYEKANPTVASEEAEEPSFETKLAQTAGEDPDILLAKISNAQQLQIALDIEQNDVLLVQGPPGTGKTHTIANLMGHFLAQGKRILVTSEKVKALSVLKEKLPLAIQPLCVSRLEDKGTLFATVNQLQAELSSKTPMKLKKSISVQESERKVLIESLSKTRKQIYALRQQDVAQIVVNGKGYSFIDLGKLVKDGEEKYSKIIPGKVIQGAVCPLSDIQLVYETNGYWSKDFEAELMLELPAAEKLPTPIKCKEMFQALSELKNQYLSNEQTVSEFLKTSISGVQTITFRVNGSDFLKVPKSKRASLDSIKILNCSFYDEQDPIINRMLVIGADDTQLIEKVSEIPSLLDNLAKAKKQLRVTDEVFDLNPTCDTKAVEDAAKWFIQNRPDGVISSRERLFSKVFKSKAIEYEQVLKSALLGDRLPASEIEFRTVLLVNQMQKDTNEIVRVWNRFVSEDSLLSFEKDAPDRINDLLAKSKEIQQALDWWKNVFYPLIQTFNRESIVPLTLRNLRGHSPAERIRLAKAFMADLLKILQHEEYSRDLDEFEKWRKSALDKLQGFAEQSSIVTDLKNALSRDGSGYTEAYDRLLVAEREQEKYLSRTSSLLTLCDVAPDWAQALIDGKPGFDVAECPDNILEAWEWKQLELRYRELASQTLDDLQKTAERDAKRLRDCTAKLAADKAWLAVMLRLNGTGELSALLRMALFLEKSLGKGKNAERNRKEALALLPQCNCAVPAWIMTLDQAIGSFGSAGQFDVIIVDEASQADITSLPILYMSKKIIVVGDDKQVTPETVGAQIDTVNKLSDQYLKNFVKSPGLFDMKMSLYGLIKANAFRSRMLVEHFRCVPEIIGFCNELCYEGRIRPLRDKNDTQLMPAIVPWHVDTHGRDVATFNSVEAEVAIDLIKSMIAQPEYKGKTFGLITMRSSKGEVENLRSLINDRIDPKEKIAREIICGTSAEFQGDERDVILMMLCDTAEPDQTLRLLRPESNDFTAMKRYNVAVSRAKDQLWVLHSFDPATQLRQDDIRSRLFGWIKGLQSGSNNEQKIQTLADSEFEVRVAKALVERGYSIEQQHQVGSFRIDIVVHGKNDSVALECDGDRYHSSDEAIRNDMERQAILERNGWRFIRIRGGEYFRDPEKTIERVCAELKERGVEPNLEISQYASSDLLQRIKETFQRKDFTDYQTDDERIDRAEIASSLNSFNDGSLNKSNGCDESCTKQIKQNDEDILESKEDEENEIQESVCIASDLRETDVEVINNLQLKVEKEKYAEIKRKVKEEYKEIPKNQEEKKLAHLPKPVKGLKSSPVPTKAYSKRENLSKDEVQRIIEEDHTMWAEFEKLGCVVIDKREKKGALWIVPPEGVNIKSTIYSFAKRFKVPFVESKGGRATHNHPGWFMPLTKR